MRIAWWNIAQVSKHTRGSCAENGAPHSPGHRRRIAKQPELPRYIGTQVLIHLKRMGWHQTAVYRVLVSRYDYILANDKETTEYVRRVLTLKCI